MTLSSILRLPAFKRSTFDLELRAPAVDLPREVFTVLEAGGVPTFRQALPRLSAELQRARRYQRPFALALLRSELGTLATADRSRPLSLFSALFASALREVLRETDIVTYAAAAAGCIVAMPEVSELEAWQTVRRLQQMSSERGMPAVHGGVAAFPVHGWTVEELLRHAESAPPPALPVPVDLVGERRS
jgi:hypothetical protein